MNVSDEIQYIETVLTEKGYTVHRTVADDGEALQIEPPRGGRFYLTVWEDVALMEWMTVRMSDPQQEEYKPGDQTVSLSDWVLGWINNSPQ